MEGQGAAEAEAGRHLPVHGVLGVAEGDFRRALTSTICKLSRRIWHAWANEHC